MRNAVVATATANTTAVALAAAAVRLDDNDNGRFMLPLYIDCNKLLGLISLIAALRYQGNTSDSASFLLTEREILKQMRPAGDNIPRQRG